MWQFDLYWLFLIKRKKKIIYLNLIHVFLAGFEVTVEWNPVFDHDICRVWLG